MYEQFMHCEQQGLKTMYSIEFYLELVKSFTFILKNISKSIKVYFMRHIYIYTYTYEIIHTYIHTYIQLQIIR